MEHARLLFYPCCLQSYSQLLLVFDCIISDTRNSLNFWIFEGFSHSTPPKHKQARQAAGKTVGHWDRQLNEWNEQNDLRDCVHLPSKSQSKPERVAIENQRCHIRGISVGQTQRHHTLSHTGQDLEKECFWQPNLSLLATNHTRDTML
jgi:hypothetical protein